MTYPNKMLNDNQVLAQELIIIHRIVKLCPKILIRALSFDIDGPVTGLFKVHVT